MFCVSFLLDETMKLEMMSGFEEGAETDFQKEMTTDCKINDSKKNNYVGDIASILI